MTDDFSFSNKKNTPPKSAPVEKKKADGAKEVKKNNWGDMVFRKDYIMTNKAKAMKEHLGKQALVKTLIPRDPREPKISFLRFNMNGLSFSLPKGKFVNIPEQVAQYINEMYMQDIEIANNHERNLKNVPNSDKFLS